MKITLILVGMSGLLVQACSMVVQPNIDIIPCQSRSDGTDPCPDGMRCNMNANGMGYTCEYTRRPNPLVVGP